MSRFSELNSINMAEEFAVAFAENGQLQQAIKLRKNVLEARQRTLGSQHTDTLSAMQHLAVSYSDLGRGQDTIAGR